MYEDDEAHKADNLFLENNLQAELEADLLVTEARRFLDDAQQMFAQLSNEELAKLQLALASELWVRQITPEDDGETPQTKAFH